MNPRHFPIEKVQQAISALIEVTDSKAKPLAESMGLGSTAIRDILLPKAKSVSTPTLNAIARHFQITVEDLLEGRDATMIAYYAKQNGKVTTEGLAQDIVTIQKLDLSLSMGPGTLIDDWVEDEPIAFDRAFLELITRAPANRLKLVTGIGDSMYPTLNWGDAIMIDTTDKMLARQDGIYWISLFGAAGIKRLRTIGEGRVLVKSDNATVDDQEIDAADLRIEGRAIWVARGL